MPTRKKLVGKPLVKLESLLPAVQRQLQRELKSWKLVEMPQTQPRNNPCTQRHRPRACSIGGEVPLLIFDAEKQEVKSLAGQGRAPLSQHAVDWYMENGIPNWDIKMAPVPSVVDLCTTTLKQYGTMTFENIVAPTLALLDAGEADWHSDLTITLRRMVEEERKTAGNREQKIQAASDRFYGRNGVKSDIADALEGFYIEKGGFLRKRDLAAHATPIEDPVTVEYQGYTVCKCGPWTQGPYLCQALRLLEGFDLKTMGHLSTDYVHVVTEALKLAMADRDAYYGDPEFVDVPLAALLSEAYTDIRRPLIDMKTASHEARPGDVHNMQPLKADGVFRPSVGGTTTCVIADRWGNVVSATPSANVYHAGGMVGPTGVSYGNRLRSLNTTPGHPNCIQPGKRPRITLTPTLVLKEGAPILAISVAGGRPTRSDNAEFAAQFYCVRHATRRRGHSTTVCHRPSRRFLRSESEPRANV